MAENQQSMTLQDALELAIKHHQAGQLDTATAIYQQILQIQYLIHTLFSIFLKHSRNSDITIKFIKFKRKNCKSC